MGSKAGEPDERPVHRVEVKTFWMAKTEVTVAQYRRCVQAGRCSVPATGEFYNWDETERKDHPINGVTWRQAAQFARWAGGRLPSEAEWEYAARSGGETWKFPWGDRKASCLFAVMDDGGSHDALPGASGKETDGCGKNRTWPVCSKPRGNTTHGLCDMAGNVNEWVQDWYQTSYEGAPKNGEAWNKKETTVRVSRGGSLISEAKHLRVNNRIRIHPKRSYITLGLRPVRSF